MKSKSMSLTLFAFLSGILFSCKKDQVEVKFMKFQNQAALFTVENNTEQDIYTVTFEVTLFSKDKSILKIDTVDYSNSIDSVGNTIPFVEAGKDTFFPYGITQETTSASARTLNFGFKN